MDERIIELRPGESIALSCGTTVVCRACGQDKFQDFEAVAALDDPTDALDEAVKAAGGVAQLAASINVATSLPSMWRQRGRVPAEHCPAIERETGVRCERLRPDIPWHVLRLQPSSNHARTA